MTNSYIWYEENERKEESVIDTSVPVHSFYLQTVISS